MDIKIEKNTLLNGLNIVLKAVSYSSVMPILKCVLLNVEESGLRLTTNDLELCIETKALDADIEQTGKIAVEAKLFAEIIKKLPDDYVQILTTDKLEVEIKSGKSKFKIMGQDPEQFPALPEVIKDNKFTIDQGTLKDVLRQTCFSIDAEAQKAAFTGELFDISKSEINLVSSDGFRISHRSLEVDKTDLTYSTIIPGKSIIDIMKILETSDSKANIYFEKTYALFDLETCKVITRVIAADFIDYQNFFNAEYSTLVKLNTEDFINCVDRACIVAETNKKTPVKLDIKDKSIAITSQTQVGNVYEEINADIDGNCLTIRFNPRYLMEALRAIEDEEVTIQFSSSLTPCIIRPVDSGNFEYLILPLRLEN